MRVVVAHPPARDVRRIRQIVLGAGLDCGLEDCVTFKDLTVRLSQTDANLVFVKAGVGEAVDWDLVREAMTSTSAPLMAIGLRGDEQEAVPAKAAGVSEFLDEADLRRSLDTALERITSRGRDPRQRGQVISVFAPAPGTGGSTVAANLAGALNEKHPHEVALVELSQDSSELAFLLNVTTPQYTANDICRRWEKLDATSMKKSLFEHATGIRVLANASDRMGNGDLHVESVRRIAVLSRITFRFTVLALDSRLGDEELEAMRMSDSIAFVVRPDVPAVRRAAWALNLATEKGIPRQRFHLVVNRWGQAGQIKLKDLESSLNLEHMQLIPDDPKRVNTAANRGELLQQLSRGVTINKRFAALATKLNGTSSA